METLPKRVKNAIRSLPIFFLGLALLLAAADNFSAKTMQGQEVTAGDPTKGGRLYVAWDLVNDSPPPTEMNGLWPTNTTNTVPNRFTWRCVNCHSWDYRGSLSETQNSLFRSQDYPSLFGMMEKTPEEILPWLNGYNNPQHDFRPYLSEQNMNDLSAFLSTGLFTPDLIANVETQLVSGTLSVGETAYNEYCASCHGMEGEKLNFGTTQTPSFMGDVSLTNPWRVAHTIRYGHISTRVPPAEVLGLAFSQQIDIIAYTQTFPTANTIIDPAYQEIDFSSQAPTEPLAIGAMLLGILVFGAVLISVRVRNR